MVVKLISLILLNRRENRDETFFCSGMQLDASGLGTNLLATCGHLAHDITFVVASKETSSKRS